MRGRGQKGLMARAAYHHHLRRHGHCHCRCLITLNRPRTPRLTPMGLHVDKKMRFKVFFFPVSFLESSSGWTNEVQDLALMRILISHASTSITSSF